MKRLLLDMDPGIDDALALLLALNAERDKEVVVEGITAVAGNVEAELAAENILRILELAGRAYRIFQPGIGIQPGGLDQPGCLDVAVGAGAPLNRRLRTAKFVHGEDGLGNTGLPASRERGTVFAITRTALNTSPGVDSSTRFDATSGTGVSAAAALIHQKAGRWPGEITLVATGPLTNVAQALLASPKLAVELKEIVLMGGAATVPGNATPVAEFNIFADPEAAAVVFSSGARVTMVGLDATTQVTFTAEDLAAWRTVAGPVAGFVCALAEFWFSRFKKAEFHLHDPVAVGVALDQSLVRTVRERVFVETRGEFTTGQTVVDRRPMEFRKDEAPDREAAPADSGESGSSGVYAKGLPLPEICLEIDAERFKRYFWDKVAGGAAGKTNPDQAGKKA